MIIYIHRTVKKKKKIHTNLKIKIIKLNTYNRYQNILQTLKYTSSLMKTINNTIIHNSQVDINILYILIEDYYIWM